MSAPKITFVMPTRDRRERILQTLSILECNTADTPHEVIVIDNASSDDTPEAIREQFPNVRLIELSQNLNAAARNLGLSAAQSDLVFMLDDDSWPEEGAADFALQTMAENPRLGVAACCVTRYGQTFHEMGGLPGVFIGCGAVLRKKAAMEVGGYPVDYGYYVEEYDLCARLWQASWQVKWFEDLRATHNPASGGRDKNRILKMLVANNLRFWSRFAPQQRHESMIEETIERYRKIARKEDALTGYREGLAIGLTAVSANSSRRKPLTEAQFDSLFGLDHLRRLLRHTRSSGIGQLLLWRRGKGAEQILEAVCQAGLTVSGIVEDSPVAVENGPLAGIPTCSVEDAHQTSAQAVLIGSLSPGVSLDLVAEARTHLPHMQIIDPVARQAVPTAV